MTFVAIPNTIKLEMAGKIEDENWACIFHWRYGSGVPSAAQLNALAQTAFSTWAENFAAITQPATSLQLAVATDVGSDQGASGLYSGEAPGTAPSVKPCTGSSCLLISKPTATRYRGGHGRTYLPTVSDINLANPNTWDPAIVQAALDGYIAWASRVAAGGGALGNLVEVIVHRILNKVPLFPPRTDPVVAVAADSQVASQRRRLHGTGSATLGRGSKQVRILA